MDLNQVLAADDGSLLAAEDRAILALECPTVVGHTCKIIRLASPGLSVDDVRSIIASRLTQAPVLMNRLGGLPDSPCWVPDPDFDVVRHVVAAPLDAALDDEELRGLVGALFAQHLDRDRPLWQLDVVQLADGGSALIWRLHHALADGTTIVRWLRALLWDPVETVDEAPTTAARVSLDEQIRRRGHLAGFIAREYPRSRHRSPFDGDIGTQREIGLTSLSLTELKRSARSLAGATVNDALLAVVAGAVRRYLKAHHGLLSDIPCRVPVSLHHEGDITANRDSFFSVKLPLHVPDPVERLRLVHAATVLRKEAHDAELEDELLQELAKAIPLQRFVERLNASPRRFAVSVSNVPGPRHPVSISGIPVTHLIGLAEIGMRHALRVAAVSMDNTLSLGFCADPSLVPDVQTMADAAQSEAVLLSSVGG